MCVEHFFVIVRTQNIIYTYYVLGREGSLLCPLLLLVIRVVCARLFFFFIQPHMYTYSVCECVCVRARACFEYTTNFRFTFEIHCMFRICAIKKHSHFILICHYMAKSVCVCVCEHVFTAFMSLCKEHISIYYHNGPVRV